MPRSYAENAAEQNAPTEAPVAPRVADVTAPAGADTTHEDTPGQETAEQLRKKDAELGYEISQEMPRSGKDWNEYLQKRKALERGR